MSVFSNWQAKACFVSILLSLVLGLSACEEDNRSVLDALSQPGVMHIVDQCIMGTRLAPLSDCLENEVELSHALYVANMDKSSVAFAPFSARKQVFTTIDITRSVPGMTAIAVGERPQSMANDAIGAILVITSSLGNDLSIISTLDNRELAYQKLDKAPRHVYFDSETGVFNVFFIDGSLRKLDIDYDCGLGSKVIELSCHLSKEMLKITWEDVGTLGAKFSSFTADPVRHRAYVSYVDKRYISVLGFSEKEGKCLDGGSVYPCELTRLGAGFSCADGIDNNGDTLIDSADPTCYYPWSAEGEGFAGYLGIGACNDLIDNDGDGLIDALDPGCVSAHDASEEEGYQAFALGTCGILADANGNGLMGRNDPSCVWPLQDESEDMSASLGSGLCSDGIDNDGDTLVDTADVDCYGKLGISEAPMSSVGRGPMAVDPQGRWLYVIDAEDSQLIVIDLVTGKTLDRSGFYPRQQNVGIPLLRIALSLTADIEEWEIYNKGGHVVMETNAVVYVSSSAGLVTQYTIHRQIDHFKDDVLVNSLEELALRATDKNTESSYVGTVRCVGRICTEADVPIISLRQRGANAFFSDVKVLSNIHPKTGKPYTVPYDSIISSETWRVSYEGSLEKDMRTDGRVVSEGVFETNSDLCLIGAQVGDHLIVMPNESIRTDLPQCAGLTQGQQKSFKRLEWRISEVTQRGLKLETTGDPLDADILPHPDCLGNGLSYEIRASKTWIITSNNTAINRRLTTPKGCVDLPTNPYGQTRFVIDPKRSATDIDAQTAFFSVRLPDNAAALSRGDAYEFTTRSGHAGKNITVASAPTDMLIFESKLSSLLLVSEASANTILIYDLFEEATIETL